jgi:hypothetical protein
LRTGGAVARGADLAGSEGARDDHAGLVTDCGGWLTVGRAKVACGEVVVRDREGSVVSAGVLRRVSVGA